MRPRKSYWKHKFHHLPGMVFTKSCLFSLSWETTCLERPQNVVVALYRFHCSVYLRAIWQQIPQPPFTWVSLKIIYLKLIWDLPGANELTHWGQVTHIYALLNRSSLLQVAWSAPSHYPNQCWLIVNWTPESIFQWNLDWNSIIFIQENAFENISCKMAAILSRPECVNTLAPE